MAFLHLKVPYNCTRHPTLKERNDWAEKNFISRADQVEKSTSCPHGRPTMLRLTLRDLEKQFHRTWASNPRLP